MNRRTVLSAIAAACAAPLSMLRAKTPAEELPGSPMISLRPSVTVWHMERNPTPQRQKRHDANGTIREVDAWWDRLRPDCGNTHCFTMELLPEKNGIKEGEAYVPVYLTPKGKTRGSLQSASGNVRIVAYEKTASGWIEDHHMLALVVGHLMLHRHPFYAHLYERSDSPGKVGHNRYEVPGIVYS